MVTVIKNEPTGKDYSSLRLNLTDDDKEKVRLILEAGPDLLQHREKQ